MPVVDNFMWAVGGLSYTCSMQADGGVDAGHGPAAPPGGCSATVALAAVAAAVDGLLAADLSLPGTAELLDLLREVERQSRRLAAASVAVIGQIDARGVGRT